MGPWDREGMFGYPGAYFFLTNYSYKRTRQIMNKHYLTRLEETAQTLTQITEELADQPNDWQTVKQNTLIWVRNKDTDTWRPRYLSHVSDECNIFVFRNGADSNTNSPNVEPAPATFYRLTNPNRSKCGD